MERERERGWGDTSDYKQVYISYEQIVQIILIYHKSYMHNLALLLTVTKAIYRTPNHD